MGFFAIPLLEQSQEDLESSDEFFDVELYQGLSQFFEEEFLSMSETLSTSPEDHTAQPEAAA
jgi:hypothetical protein